MYWLLFLSRIFTSFIYFFIFIALHTIPELQVDAGLKLGFLFSFDFCPRLAWAGRVNLIIKG